LGTAPAVVVQPPVESERPGRKLGEAVEAAARGAPRVIGSTAAFLILCAAMLVWVAVGPFVGFSSGWLLVPSALASIVALLLVVLLQYSQNRDTRALQLKLDEVIRAVAEARNELVRLEELPDDQLAGIEREFRNLPGNR
jgi:low affinity Fe/Cu permease